MVSLLILAASSLLLSFLLTPLFRNAAVALGAVDRPDTSRHFHPHPVPRVGGVPIFIAILVSFSILLLVDDGGSSLVRYYLPSALKFLPAVAIIFFIGLADDLFGLKPWQKLAGQLFAAGWAAWAGVLIHGFEHHQIVGFLAVPVTIVWLIACTNAFNLIDGMDGLASGVGLFAALTTFLAALLMGNYKLQMATVPLIFALLGFLRFNFNPASIFLGDCGSLTIGFLLGCFGIVWSQKATTILGMTAPLIALSIPLVDTGLAIGRRALRGQPIFAGDRRHIHHRLLDLGLTPRSAALLIYGVCGIVAALSLALGFAWNHYAGLAIVLFCVGTWIGVQNLGYVEFNLASRLVRPQLFCRVINAQMRLRALEDDLGHAATADQCWDVVCQAAHDLGFAHVSMRLDQTVIQQTGDLPLPDSWVLRVPLSSHEFVNLARRFEDPIAPTVVGPLADILRRTLAPKLPLFQNQDKVASIRKVRRARAATV